VIYVCTRCQGSVDYTADAHLLIALRHTRDADPSWLLHVCYAPVWRHRLSHQRPPASIMRRGGRYNKLLQNLTLTFDLVRYFNIVHGHAHSSPVEVVHYPVSLHACQRTVPCEPCIITGYNALSTPIMHCTLPPERRMSRQWRHAKALFGDSAALTSQNTRRAHSVRIRNSVITCN